MLSIAVAALANVIGLAAAVLALILFSRADGNWRTSLRSRRGLGLLSLFVAGCLLGVGGQFMLSRLLSYGPASRAEAQARLQMALQEPLEALTVQVHGSDPFRDRPDACSLRLLAVTRVGQRVISELPRSRLLLPESDGAKVPATTTKDFREYIISWQSVIEGATSEEGRAVAARIGHLNDWRRFDRVEAEIVARTTESVPMPDSLRIASRADQPVELLNGRKTSEKAEQHGDVWVCAYHDHPPWLSQADRLTGWMAEEAYRTPHRGLDFILMGLLAVGSCLLVVGIRLIDGMTMINRYCGGLASTLWSSSRDGRWILPLILVAYFLILAALSSSRNLVSAWEALGVSALAPSFADTRFITATMDSQRLGHDPYIENPCDPWRRPMNYPRIWLALASFGLTQDHTMIVGVGLAVIFFGCLLCWAARMNPAQSLIFGIFLCSPHVMSPLSRIQRIPKMNS